MFDGPAVVAALKCAGVSQVVWIPDTELGAWEPALAADPDLKLIRVCREGEAIAVAAGPGHGTGRGSLIRGGPVRHVAGLARTHQLGMVRLGGRLVLLLGGRIQSLGVIQVRLGQALPGILVPLGRVVLAQGRAQLHQILRLLLDVRPFRVVVL